MLGRFGLLSDASTPNSMAPYPARPIRVFISYAWEDDFYREEVKRLATALRTDGVDVRMDYWDSKGLSIPEFMNREVRHADKVLICASPKYKHNVQLMEDGRPTGSGWEAMLVTSAIWARTKQRTQFEVAILRGSPDEALPMFLSGWPFIDLTGGDQRSYDDLLCRLTDNEEVAPALGRVPEMSLGGRGGSWASRFGNRSLSSFGIVRSLLDRLCPSFHNWLRRRGVLNTPVEYQTLSKYLIELRAHLAQEVDQRTYIVNLARRVPRSGPSDESTAAEDQFALPIQRVIRSVLGHSQGGGDSASAQLAAVNRRSRVVSNLLKTLRRSREPLILLGDPGTGKTLTLQQTALAIAKAEQRRTYPSLPIYVRLGEFHVAEGEVTEVHVLDFVKQSVREEVRPFIDSLEFDGRLIIFFDGLDEMSRQRYTEHTTALSKFAGRYSYLHHSGSKTLSSCRITDFSPAFRPSRLVLLPFSEPQIREYLVRSFPGRRFIEIDRQRWTFKRLARHMCGTDFSVDATNPFVLYLLCFYLDRKQSWPDSRAELLRFFLEQNYVRKEQERQDDLSFPPYEEAVLDWAAVAFLITSRNLGGTIAAHEIAKLPGWTLEQTERVVRLGRRCGVFIESVQGGEHLVRLDHHRLQEYLTAVHIHADHPPIDWADKMDAPRWQETLVNLVVLGGGDDAIDVLSSVIAEFVEGERRKREELKGYNDASRAPLMDDAAETVLADRIEVASRIARDASRTTLVVDKLLPVLRDAVSLLFEHGNPITQVKMIRVAIEVPEPQLIEAARRLLKSEVVWLRNQALILTSFSDADLPTSIAEDVANGELLPRILTYLKALRNVQQPGATYSLCVGVLCGVSEWVLHLATAIAIYVLSLRLIGDSGIFSKLKSLAYAMSDRLDRLKLPEPHPPVLTWIQTAVVRATPNEVLGGSFLAMSILCLAAVVTSSSATRRRYRQGYGFAWIVVINAISLLLSEPHYDQPLPVIDLRALVWVGDLAHTMLLREWLFSGIAVIVLVRVFAAGRRARSFAFSGLAVAGCVLVIPFWLVGTWRQPEVIALPVWVVVFLVLTGVAAIYNIWLGALRCAFILTYSVATAPYHRVKGMYRRFASQGWSSVSGDFRWFLVIMPPILSLPASIGYLCARQLGFWRPVLASSLFWLAAMWFVTECTRSSSFLKARVKSIRLAARRFSRDVARDPSRADPTIVVFWVLFVMLILGGVGYGIILLMEYFDVLVARIAVLVAGGVLLISCVWGLILLLQWLRYLRSKPFPPGRFTFQEWLRLLQNNGGVKQEAILARTNHESLSLTPAKFLEVLQSARGLVKEEPALSTYWRRRAELEQVLRQERRG